MKVYCPECGHGFERKVETMMVDVLDTLIVGKLYKEIFKESLFSKARKVKS